MKYFQALTALIFYRNIIVTLLYHVQNRVSYSNDISWKIHILSDNQEILCFHGTKTIVAVLKNPLALATSCWMIRFIVGRSEALKP
jgi:hypothetical protein